MFDPRKRWNLMSSSFNPSITRDASGKIPRIHPGAWARSIRHGQMMGPNYGTSGNAAINAAMARQSNPLSRTSAGELSASERAEAWALAMEDAEGFMGPMQGDTIPGVAPGGGSRDHQMGQYGTGGLDLADNRPTADPDAVRKRLYGIMGFA